MALNRQQSFEKHELAGTHISRNDLATAQTLTVPAGATMLLVQADTQNVRLRFDGTTPTASVGFVVKTGNDPVAYPVNDGMTIKAIEVATTAVLQGQFYRPKA